MIKTNATYSIAHVRRLEDGTWDKPQELQTHLKGTALLAERFASIFNSGSWGYLVGISHDTGKAVDIWQKYLKTKSGYDEEAHLENKFGKHEHSAPGAKLVDEVLGNGIGRIISYCIAGHHAGLADWIGSQSSLAYRLHNASSNGIPSVYKDQLFRYRTLQPPWKLSRAGLDMSLWIRMLFSCLVDADFLDTESYMNPAKRDTRGEFLTIPKLLASFDDYIAKKQMEAKLESKPTLYKARQSVLEDCRAAAHSIPGFFSLTVPTGGGKTLSSMAFALNHAITYGKDRIIYVIPYTSIIEQNADVFREAIGQEQVVEHHSNLDSDDSTPKARLAAENWDAPVIVTTSVQFFESLFATRPSKCRKLHNIANSVVILDESQLVPVEYLEPILSTLKLLSERYGVSVVLCTATQPAFESQVGFPSFSGLPEGSIREIVSDVPSLYKKLQRVEIDLPLDYRSPRTWEDLSNELVRFKQVLCIVSDRRSCRELHALLPAGSYHLSALMCPQHRSDIIAEIKRKLRSGEPIRVVSTQIVEAGVDIDFPVVYRAMSGLDSIAQAAGRCNREGRLGNGKELGKVVIFIPPRKAPIGLLRKACETTSRLLESGQVNPMDHDVFTRYFSELFWKANSLDTKGIVNLLTPESNLGIQFRSASEAFKIIDDSAQRIILVPYKDGDKHISELRSLGPERWLLRKLQRYSITVYTDQFNKLRNRGSIEEVSPGIFALTCDIEYDPTIGLLVDELPTDPCAYIG